MGSLLVVDRTKRACGIREESNDKAGLPGRRSRQSGGRHEGPSGGAPGLWQWPG